MKPISFNFLTTSSRVDGLDVCRPQVKVVGQALRAMSKRRRARWNNPNSAAPQGAYPATDRNVFLIYGDNVGPDDQVETNHEGDFVFQAPTWRLHRLRLQRRHVHNRSSPRHGGAPTGDNLLCERDLGVGHPPHFQRTLSLGSKTHSVDCVGLVAVQSRVDFGAGHPILVGHVSESKPAP